jgi:hypothetical protein
LVRNGCDHLLRACQHGCCFCRTRIAIHMSFCDARYTSFTPATAAISPHAIQTLMKGVHREALSSLPRLWPLVSAVQAEGSFAFNRIAAWLSLRVQAWLFTVDRSVRSCTEERSPDAHRLLPGGGNWGWENACDSPYGALVCVSFASLVPPTLIFHTTCGCTGVSSGMWAALARF